LRALTQRVEAGESKVLVMGSKSTLFRAFVAPQGGKFGGKGRIKKYSNRNILIFPLYCTPV
jgi:hypothetical protein